MKTGKRGICVALSITMITTLLAGCSHLDEMYEKAAEYMETDQTISKDSKWVNSDLVGVMKKDTVVSEKDDFAAAVNKDWILSVEDQVEKAKSGSVSVVEDNEDVVIQQKKALLDTAIAGNGFAENKVGMNPADYDHMSDEFTKIVSTFADWDARNQAGVKPLEKYLSAIEAINSLDQMSEYLCNRDGELLSNAYLIPFIVDTSLNENENRYFVTLTSRYEDSLDAGEESGSLFQNYVMDIVSGILKQAGYSSSEAEKIVKQCWQTEMALSEHTAYSEIMENVTSEDELKRQFNHEYTAQELEKLAGTYPIMDILKTYDYDQSEKYVVYEPDYVREVAKFYQEKNLDKIKSYYIVHTVLSALPLLTRDDYDQYEEYFMNVTDDQKDAQNKNDDEEEKKEEESLNHLSKEDKILQTFTTNYINEIFEEMYVTNYCSAEQKEYIENLIQEAIKEYENILENEEWMSEETKQKAIEKLNAITVRVLYPDELDDCNDLQVEAGNLTDIAAKINVYKRKKEADKINEKVDKKVWNLNLMPTTTVNAYYSQTDNSVIILSGIVANRELLDMNVSDEENMAHLGYIIGHEISHAFDTSGYLYDKDGNETKWWTDQDEEVFQERVRRLANYYSSFKYFRNATENVNGERIQGEAIADMGGVKCMLAIGRQKEDFDYQKFFRAFARTWATCRKYSVEMQMVSQDDHPLPFLRINVTLQQFEEFYKAFDIQPGDGMYLAPEKRIAVW